MDFFDSIQPLISKTTDFPMKNSLLLSVLAFLCLFPNFINAQTNFSVDGKSMGDVIKHIHCEFEDQIQVSPSDITTFISSLISSTSNTSCDALEASITVSTASSLRFEWPDVAGSQSYSAAGMGLGNGTIMSYTTTSPKVIFNGLSQQLYLFAFVNHCSTSSSIVNIIIVDKDLNLVPYELEEEYCLCEEDSGKATGGEKKCKDSFEALYLSWNNTCDANRYHFSISEYGSEEEKELLIVAEQIEEQTSLYVIRSCGNFQYDEESYTIEASNYNAILTSQGIHFYPTETEGTDELQVIRTNCGCYNKPVKEEKKEKGKKRNAQQELLLQNKLQVTPNPFDNFLNISIGETSNSPTEVFVFDLSGRLVQQSKQESASGFFSISTESLELGIYQLVLKNAQQTWQQKIVKMK